MLIIAILTLLLAVTPSIEKNYNYLSDYIKFNRIVFIIFILAAYLAYNVLNVEAIGDGVGIFGGVFKITVLSQVFDIILCIIGAIVVILTCFAPYQYKIYDDTKVMEYFMNTDNDKNLNSRAILFKNSFKDFYYYKLLKFYNHNDHKNKSNIYIYITKFLNNISNYLPNLNIKFPFILENKSWYSKLEVKEFSFLLLYTVIGASLLISSNNLVSLYLSLELQSFTLYILSASQVKSFRGTSGGLKYFLLGGLSSGFILLACSLLYAYTGTLNIEHIFYIYSDTSVNYIIDPCLIILFAGLLFKISAAPFHNWAPDVYSDVPTYTTTWLIVVAKVSILVFMLILVHHIYSALNLNNLELFDNYFHSNNSLNNFINLSSFDTILHLIIYSSDNFTYNTDTSIVNNLFNINNDNNIPFSFWNVSYSSLGLWTNIITISALLSLIIGTIVGLSQSRIKRLFAYSTIAHVGFLLLALSLNTVNGIDAFIFYLIQYSITNLNLFFILVAWGYLFNKYYLDKDYLYIRHLNINPLSWKDIYISPTMFDYGKFIKNKLNEENYIHGHNYPYNNLKVNTINQYLSINVDNTQYDFETEDTELLYTPVPFLTNFKGMHFKDPFLAFCLTITLLSLAGIPPMIGFFAKQQVLLASLQSDFFFISIIAIGTSIIGAAYYLRIIKFIYFYDEVFIPHYLNNINSDNYSNNNVFFEYTSNDNDSLPMLPSNNLSLIIAILTNISLFYFIKPYILINIINMITIPLFLS